MWVIFLTLHSNIFKFTAFSAVQTWPVQYAEDMSDTAQYHFSLPFKNLIGLFIILFIFLLWAKPVDSSLSLSPVIHDVIDP